MSLNAILVIFEKGDRVGTKYSPRNLYIGTFWVKSYIFTRGKKIIHRKIFPQFLNHFLNKEVSLPTKVLVLIQHFSHLAFLIDLENDAHNLNIYIRHKANTLPCERRILHSPLTLHHGVGHCKRDITRWQADYSFSLIQTRERKTSYRFCRMFSPHYSRSHFWLQLGENPL